MKIYNELEFLGFFKWLSETHNLKDTDMTPEYLDELPLNDIHRTVCNSVAFRWFREKYDLQYNIVWNKFYDKTPYQYEVRPTWRNEPLRPYGTSGMCSTYEEAELECLKKLIEIIKEK
jgi:hypothetical protein